MNVATTVNHATRTASATVTFSAAAGESAQPVRIDWGDGSIQSLASGFANPTTHVYTKDGYFKVVVQANDVRATEMIRVGAAPGYPAWEAKKVKDRRQAAADELAGLASTKGLVG